MIIKFKETVFKASFATLIVRVDSICKVFGGFETFEKKYNLWGASNEHLFSVTQMMIPPNELNDIILDILIPNGLKQKEDFVIVYEQLAKSIQGTYSALLNKKHPFCLEIEWLGSVVAKNGNWFWFLDPQWPLEKTISINGLYQKFALENPSALETLEVFSDDENQKLNYKYKF